MGFVLLVLLFFSHSNSFKFSFQTLLHHVFVNSTKESYKMVSFSHNNSHKNIYLLIQLKRDLKKQQQRK